MKNILSNKTKNIAHKITQAIVTVALCSSIIIGLVGVINIVIISNNSEKMYSEDLVPIATVYKISSDYSSVQVDLRSLLLNIGDNSTTQSNIKTAFADIHKQLANYQKELSSPEEKSNYTAMKIAVSSYESIKSEFLMYLQFENRDKAQALISGNDSKALNNSITKALTLSNNQAQQRNQTSKIQLYIALVAIAAFIIAFILIASKVGKRIARRISDPINKMVTAANSIASGNLNVDIDTSAKDETGILARAFVKISSSLHLLKADVDTLIGGALDGRLDTRADITRHQGAYREIIDGVNQSLDAITLPLNTAADYVDQISRGELPQIITDDYKGDFNKLKVNLNTCIGAINGLITDANMLSEAAVAGNLSARADVSLHQGDYRRIIEGVNNTLDAITAPLNMAADYVDRISRGSIPEPVTDEYNGDFNKIKVNLNTCIGAINGLIVDANMLSEAAVAGDLSARADASKHHGDFRRIIKGVNSTLDAITMPLNTAADYIEKISKGDMPKKITEDFSGDFNIIKNNINTCINAVNGLISWQKQLKRADSPPGRTQENIRETLGASSRGSTTPLTHLSGRCRNQPPF